MFCNVSLLNKVSVVSWYHSGLPAVHTHRFKKAVWGRRLPGAAQGVVGAADHTRYVQAVGMF